MNTAPHIPHSKPCLGEEEAAAAAVVIRSGQIAQAKRVAALENSFARFCGRPAGAVAVNSGTAALHLTLAAMGTGKGDEVIISDFVCTALLNAVRHAGARPVPADIDPKTLNMDPKDVTRRITEKTKAIIAVHLFGMPADMNALMSIGMQRKVPVIEDCAQSVGATIDGRPLGGIGHASVFSFYATKVITCGEGGLALFSSGKAADRARDLRDYDNHADDTTRWNYKMTDIQAAIAQTQFNRLGEFINRRKEIAERYTAAFAGLDVELPFQAPGRIWFRYVIGLRKDHSVESWIKKMADYGIACAKPVFAPIHRMLGISGYGNSESAWNRLVSIPVYPAMTDREVDRVIDAVRKTSREAA
ncbi:MAG: DegT/DnrJ/EryC1/StrS family aminotransferase [Deltaproteobacteria bacterium]|nr:DegT/DnrJ/EryC1/StrS family aminotransferase [Deltaproteobacteria bacterium]